MDGVFNHSSDTFAVGGTFDVQIDNSFVFIGTVHVDVFDGGTGLA